jgi:hypothetical protein
MVIIISFPGWLKPDFARRVSSGQRLGAEAGSVSCAGEEKVLGSGGWSWVVGPPGQMAHLVLLLLHPSG